MTPKQIDNNITKQHYKTLQNNITKQHYKTTLHNNITKQHYKTILQNNIRKQTLQRNNVYIHMLTMAHAVLYHELMLYLETHTHRTSFHKDCLYHLNYRDLKCFTEEEEEA